LVDLRLQRIQELEVESLKKEHPMTALWGATTSDLMLFGLQWKESITQQVAMSPGGVSVVDLREDVEMYLRIVRQMGYLSHLQRQAPAG